MTIHNLGTINIDLESDIEIIDEQGNTVSGIWKDLDDNTITLIEPGEYGKAIVDCCGIENNCPKTCEYMILISGRSYDVAVYCPGD